MADGVARSSEQEPCISQVSAPALPEDPPGLRGYSFSQPVWDTIFCQPYLFGSGGGVGVMLGSQSTE